MKFVLILLLTFSWTYDSAAQATREIRYYDSEWKPCQKRKAEYYRVVESDSGSHSMSTVKDYYMNGKLQWEGHIQKKYEFEMAEFIGVEGLCTWYYQNGRILQKGFYINSKLEGLFVSYYENGNKNQELNYKRGLLNGKGISYYESGRVFSEFEYVNDKQNGVIERFFDTTGTDGQRLVKERLIYANDRLTGNHTKYFPNGSIYISENYSDSLLEGEKTIYFQNGNIQEKSNFQHGQLHGPSIFYYSDGSIQRVTNYISGKENGEAIGYFSNGQVYSKSNYINGNPDGESITYFENGHAQSRGFYVNGMMEGDFVTYNDTGRVIDRKSYQGGKLTEVESWNGEVRKFTWYESERVYNGKQWYPNGTLMLEENHYPGGYTFTRYDTNGNVERAKLADTILVHPVKDNIACLYGFKNYKNEWVLQPQFNYYQEYGKYYIVTRDTKCGVLNFRGDLIIPLSWDAISFVSVAGNGVDTVARASDGNDYIPSAGLFRVKRDKQVGIINRDGRILVPVAYDQIENIGGGFVRVRKDRLFGFADTSGYLVPPKFKYLQNFNAGDYCLFSDTNPERLPYEVRKYGAINTKGDTLIPCIYNWISSAKTYNLIWVGKDLKIGAYTVQGKKVFDLEFEITENSYYRNPDFTADSLALVRKAGKFGIVKADGSFFVPATYDAIQLIPYYQPGDNSRAIALLKSDRKWSVINKSGARILDSYDELKKLSETTESKEGKTQHHLIFLASKKNKYGIINERDSVLFPFIYDYAFADPNNKRQFFLIRNDSMKLYDCMNLTEPVPLTHSFNSAAGIFTFCLPADPRKPGKLACGAVNRNGKVILQPRYTTGICNGNYLVYITDSGETAILNEEGNVVLPAGQCNAVGEIEGDLACIISRNDHVGVLDLKEKKWLIDTVWEAISKFDVAHNICWVKEKLHLPDSASEFEGEEDYLSMGWKLMDANQRFIRDEEYDYPSLFDEADSLAVVYQGGNKGILKSDGTVILPCKYNEIHRQENGLYIISDGKWGLANADGKILVTPQWEDASPFIGDYMLFWAGEKTGIADASGKIVVSPSNDLGTNRRMLSSFFKVVDPRLDQYGGIEEGYGTDTVLVRGYRKIEKYFKAHPDSKTKRIVSNRLISGALQNYKFSNTVESGNYAYHMHDAPVYYRSDARLDYYEDYKNTGCTENTEITVEVAEMTGKTFSYSEKSEFSSICSRGPGYSEVSREFYNYGIYSPDSIFPIMLEDLFLPGSGYQEKINSLLLKEIAKLEDLELDCSDQSRYIEMVEQRFTLASKGIKFFLNTDMNPSYYDESNEIELYIPFSSLKTILKKNGIIAGVQ